jgi:hypothetical protein
MTASVVTLSQRPYSPGCIGLSSKIVSVSNDGMIPQREGIARDAISDAPGHLFGSRLLEGKP